MALGCWRANRQPVFRPSEEKTISITAKTYHGTSHIDACSDEEGGTVSDTLVVGSKQHSVSDNAQNASGKHERPSHLQLVRRHSRDQDEEERHHVWWYGEELSRGGCVTQVFDEGWEE